MDVAYMPRVIAAEYVQDYTLKIGFTDGSIAVVDFTNWLDGGIFEPLKNKVFFQKFFVDGWTVSWPNGADIAPETLYECSKQAISRTPNIKNA